MKNIKNSVLLAFWACLSFNLAAQNPVDPALKSRETQIQLRKLANEGGAEAEKTLRNLAMSAQGAYDVSQATEAYLDLLGRKKESIKTLKTFLAEKIPVSNQIKVMDLIFKKDPQAPIFGIAQIGRAELPLAAFILKKILLTPNSTLIPVFTKTIKTWDLEHQKLFVDAIGNLKASWALSLLNLTQADLKTSQLISLIKVKNKLALPEVWAKSSTGSIDVIALGEAIVSLSVNSMLEKEVGNFSKLSSNQQAILMIYGSYRQWVAVKPHVWLAVQSNGATRSAAFYSLHHWVTPQDFDIIAGKLSIAELPMEIKALQACLTSIFKAESGLSSYVTVYALKAAQKRNWIPFVQDEENLNWLYTYVKSKNEDALRAFIRINSRSNKNETQQILRFRNALACTENKEIRDQIFKSLGKCNSLSAMRTLHSALSEPISKNTAADGLANLYISNPGFQGQMTRDWVQEAMPHMSPEQKDSISKLFAKGGMSTGFYSMFSGQDLNGWKGLVDNPVKRRNMQADTLAKKQMKADEVMRKGWYAKDDELHFSGHGENLCSVKDYQDLEMFVDWKIEKDGDAGIYLRGSPQVQIWDISRTNVGAQVGSGGLYNNTKNPKNPSVVADNSIDEWNTFRIIMRGERVTVYLNGEKVVDQVILENYWDRKIPIFVKDAIELQAHGNHITYRNIYVKELVPQATYEVSEQEKSDGFETLFDGSSLAKWTGNTVDYIPENGELAIYPKRGGKGNLYTVKEYGNFHFKFDFQLTAGSNNGLGIRAPLDGDAAYVGMELQILDNTAPMYAKLQPYQYHGSVYGIMAAKQGFLKPIGEWNSQEVIANGNQIKVILNGETILDGDIAEATKDGIPDHKAHPGLFNKTGHLGFLGHGDSLRFRNLRIKEISEIPTTTKKKKK